MNTENKSHGFKMRDLPGLLGLLTSALGPGNLISLEWTKTGMCWDTSLEDMTAHVHPTGEKETGRWDAFVNHRNLGAFDSQEEAIDAASRELITQFEGKASAVKETAVANETDGQHLQETLDVLRENREEGREEIETQVTDILNKLAHPTATMQAEMIETQAANIASYQESIKNQQATIQSQTSVIDGLVQMISIKDAAITQLIGAHTLITTAETKAKAIERAISSGKLAQTLTTGESKLDQFMLVASDRDVLTFLKSFDPESRLIADEPGVFSRIKVALQGVCNTANGQRMYRLVPLTNSAKELANAGA